MTKILTTDMFKTKVKNIIYLCEANVEIHGVSGDIRSKKLRPWKLRPRS